MAEDWKELPDAIEYESAPARSQHYRVHMICGNPGLISFYDEFLSCLCEDLDNLPGCSFTISGQSLGGFEVGSQSPEQTPLSLRRQIDLVWSRIFERGDDSLGSEEKVILIGHSVGAYILLETIRRHNELRRERQLPGRIVGGLCLFPTVTHIAKSPSGLRASGPLNFPYFALLIGLLSKALVTATPIWLISRVIALVTRFPPRGVNCILAFLNSPDGVRQALHMARDEMNEITEDEWDEELWGASSPGQSARLFFLFGRNDHWVAEDTKDQLIAARAMKATAESPSKPRMEVDESGIPHGFCISMVQIVGNMILFADDAKTIAVKSLRNVPSTLGTLCQVNHGTHDIQSCCCFKDLYAESYGHSRERIAGHSLARRAETDGERRGLKSLGSSAAEGSAQARSRHRSRYPSALISSMALLSEHDHRDAPTTPKILQSSDLIFPQAATSVAAVSAAISRSSLTLSNRFHSIAADAAFVRRVHETLPGRPPVVANERCGSWYVPPDLKAGSAYFKSTDGHHGQWAFSLRRLNLQLFDLLRDDGIMIVDATRRGKHLPDALSKTVPIWCAVMNRLIFPDENDSHHVVLLPELISNSECSLITSRLPGFVLDAEKLELNVAHLRGRIQKPLEPFWVARGLDLLPENVNNPRDELTTPVYLCMASEHHDEGWAAQTSGYVQGAGDDGENWSNGLTAGLFWEHLRKLLEASEEELPQLIAELTAGAQHGDETYPIAIAQAPWLEIGLFHEDKLPRTGGGHVTIICVPRMACEPDYCPSKNVLHLKCDTGKVGSRQLRAELEKLLSFFKARSDRIEKVTVCCSTGRDISIGVGLAILCLVDDVRGNLDTSFLGQPTVDKTILRRKLSWISASIPSANPSRATLKTVNAFLMKRP